MHHAPLTFLPNSCQYYDYDSLCHALCNLCNAKSIIWVEKSILKNQRIRSVLSNSNKISMF